MIRIEILLIAATTAMAARAVTPGTSNLPLFFVGNQGQAPSQVRFMAKAPGLSVYFLRGEVLFDLSGTAVRAQFEGANAADEPRGLESLPGRANFLVGAADRWRMGLPIYGAVEYPALYSGIDMRYGGNGRYLKSEFVVAAGADPSRIRLHYAGAGPLTIDGQGRLVIPVGDNELREEAPEVYQQDGSSRTAVDARYLLTPDGGVGFAIGAYDRARPLVIDPVLSYSTLLGGTSSNSANALAVDATGAAYLTGITASYNFPVKGAFQSANGGSNDAFVAKLSPSGNTLVYCTYLGGSSDDRAYGIAVDATGAAYVTGSTASPNFPLYRPLQNSLGGFRNAFIAKLNPAGNGLVYSTYLGGNGSDVGYGIAIDGSNNAYVVGDTTSSNFPATGMQRTNKGPQNAFIAKLNAAGNQLMYSTYLGGSSIDHGAGIAVDGSGSAYVTGSTYSTNFPTANAWQSSNAGGQDAFVSRLSADGNTLLYSTYLGGSAGTVAFPEGGQAIDLDASDNAYVTGVTSSANFPVLNPAQPALTGTSDAFVAKFTASGTLSYSTYLGGSGQDIGTAIAVDSAGDAYFAGYGYSVDLPVTTNAQQSANGGAYDAFVGELNPAGNSILYLSYLGGNGSDAAAGLAIDPAGDIFVAGWTLSTNFPVVNAYQATNPSNYGAFLTKITFPSPPTVVAVSPNSGSGGSQVFTLQFSDKAGATDLTTVSALFNSTSSTASACAISYNRAQNTLALMTDSGANPTGVLTPGSGTQQNSQCVLNGSGSSAVSQGNVLILAISLTFQGGFSGAKNTYMQAVNPAGSTGWQQMGTWTIPLPPVAPAVVSVTPSTGSGTAQTFAVVFSDANGASDLAQVWLEFATAQAAAGNSCFVRYDVGPNNLYLYNDAATAWLGPITAGSASTLQNSQCVLNASGSSVTASGNTLKLNASLNFLPAFAGSKNIYAYANNASLNSGWQTEGSWTITASQINILSVKPNAGSGVTQAFTYMVSDQKGAADLTQVWMEMSTGLSATANSCYALYQSGTGGLYLLSDSTSSWLGPITPGSASMVHNSQCTLSGASSSVISSGNNLTINLGLTLSPAFVGLKMLYAYANSAAVNTGWQTMGSFTVTSISSFISVTSVTPNSGTGPAQSFRYLVTDQKGATDLTQVWMEISTALSATANSCYVLYDASPSTLYLLNDAASAWLGPVTPGTAATLQNSQCTLSASASSVSVSGTSLSVTISLTFATAFGGTKNLYVYANDAASYTGWQLGGTYTVN